MATKEQKCKIKDAAKDLDLTPNDIIAIVKERTGAEKKPAALILRPEGKELDFAWQDGRAVVRIPRMDLFDIVEIAEES